MVEHISPYANEQHRTAFETSYSNAQWRTDDFWRGKRLTPAQLLVHDVRILRSNDSRPPRLVIDEVPSSSIVPTDIAKSDELGLQTLPEPGLSNDATESRNLQELRHGYGWLKWFRGEEGVLKPLKCRWIHLNTKFPEYLEGVFVGLSDWSHQSERKLESLRRLNAAIRSNERWSKHGRFFSPFLEALDEDEVDHVREQPYLLSIPFLDWTVFPGPTPPVRFQVDDRESYASARSWAHPLRSLLQYKYRLEDTSDREKTQTYYRHKPWREDRDLDLKVRRFYGHYPTGLNADELWVLVLDSMHIVTFSSNQTWKARWPPLQLSSRIAEISFRGLRKHHFAAELGEPYDALLHAIVCLNGTVGLVHRSFWTDAPLPCSERYAAQLERLQYRLYRSPSTKLVLDLLQLQDELAIIEDITKSQIDIVTKLEGKLAKRAHASKSRGDIAHKTPAIFALGDQGSISSRLKSELQDLRELKSNTNELVNRTVQLVNIRLEDHGQAILVFTIVTVVFLPLSFLSSFFGMNVSDIRTMQTSQWVFWVCAASLTTAVVGASTFLAFYGARLHEKFALWKDSRNFHLGIDLFRRKRPAERILPAQRSALLSGIREPITVLDAAHIGTGRDWDLGYPTT